MSGMERYQDPQVIQRVLHGARTVAIVGLSSNELRASHFVGFYAARHGYRVIPVNPREEEVLGARSYPSLTDVPEPVDLVDVFRAPPAVPAIAREAVAIGAQGPLAAVRRDQPGGRGDRRTGGPRRCHGPVPQDRARTLHRAHGRAGLRHRRDLGSAPGVLTRPTIGNPVPRRQPAAGGDRSLDGVVEGAVNLRDLGGLINA